MFGVFEIAKTRKQDMGEDRMSGLPYLPESEKGI
jgi:hypothetical protein